jgi:hypothetical protein
MRAVQRVPLLLLVALSVACSAHNLAIATNQLAHGVEAVQDAEIRLHSAGIVTDASHVAWAGHFERLADGILAVNGAIRDGNEAEIRVQVVVILNLFDDLQASEVIALPTEAANTINILIASVRSVLILMGTT